MKKLLGLVLGVGVFFAWSAMGSAEMDARYAFRKPLVAVLGDAANVHGQSVQSVLQKYFETRPRFEIPAAGLEALRQMENPPQIADLSKAKLDELQPWLDVARESGADSALFAQIQRVGEDDRIAFVGVITVPAEIVFRKVVTVADRYTLASFGVAAEEGVTSFVQALPFDATVVSREGYRVVLDRGSPSFKPGARVPVFTVEKDANGIVLQETGVIQIQRADANLAFGTILVENKPAEVWKGNKARFGSMGALAMDPSGSGMVKPRAFSRVLASMGDGSLEEEAAPRKERWATFDLNLAGSLVTWSRTSIDGTRSTSNGFYPGAALRVGVKLTQNAFVEFSGVTGAASITRAGLASQANQVRLQVGYRLALNNSALSPSVNLRGGYSRTQFQVEDLPSVLGPSSASFEGLALGAGFIYPINDKFGVGLDMTALAFPSLTEAGGTSGEKSGNVTGWDFGVRGYYNFTEKVCFEAKLLFQTHSATFSGTGSRPVQLSSLSQNTRALLTGISYAF